MSRARPRRANSAAIGGARWCVLLVLSAWTAVTGPVFGQAPPAARQGSGFYDDSSETADTLLRNAANQSREGQWAKAVEIYQRVIEQYGDRVARLPKDDAGPAPPADSQLFVDVRLLCQRRLAALPPEARALYRDRVDGNAERWYRGGAADRDRARLRRVVDEAFCSSWGDDAADLLGDLAFQDGRFEEGLAYYSRVVDGPRSGAGVLVHPDPSVDRARTAAKKLLCQAALGRVPAPEELDAFSRAYPGAAGALAGHEGPYADTLASAFSSDHLPPPPQADDRWPTFAGSPTRTRVADGPIDVGSIQWRVELEPISTGRGFRTLRGAMPSAGPPTPAQRLAFHPIVLGDQVIVCDESHVSAYNLSERPGDSPGGGVGSGKLAWRHGEDEGDSPQMTRITLGLPRFTLTAHGDRIYARLGLTSAPYMSRMGGAASSYLVALDRKTDGKLLWKKLSSDVVVPKRAGEAGPRSLGFEGTPVADARNVYVALTYRDAQIQAYVACLDADTGATRWVRYIGAAASEVENQFGFNLGNMGMGMAGGSSGDSGHRLLTLDGPTIYFQTNLGAVAALDAETGAVRWVATYPRLERGGAGQDCDLNPAVVHDGLVIVAPSDAASIFAFDARGGRLVWKTDPVPEEVKLAHVLGVARGRLIATGDRVLIFDAENGKLLHTWPDSGQGFESFGRGLLAGDKIYWPTRGEIHVLDQATGLRSDPPIKLQEAYQTTGGNLAVGDGYLIVAQADQLVVFCQNRRLIQRYREEIARAPDRALHYVRMARAAEATGQEELALEALGQARQKARPSDTIDGASLRDAVDDQTFRLLRRMGQKARGAGDLAAAASQYRAAAEAARTDRDRLLARLDEAQAEADHGKADLAIATLQALLSEGPLRSIAVTVEEDRRSIRADLLIGDRLATVLRANGREVYAPYDRKARELLDRGKAAGDSRLLEEVARSYPVSDVLPDSLLALARLHDAQGQPGEAARSYRRLLTAATSDDRRAVALLGLARAYEAAELWAPARAAYEQALGRYPAVNVADEALATKVPLGTLAARRLGQPPFDRVASGLAGPALTLPLERRWMKSVEGPVRPIAADGVPPSDEAGQVFLSKNGSLRPVAPATGASAWTARLGGEVVWVGYLDDRVLAATDRRIVAIDLDKGGHLWQYDAAGPAAETPLQDGPFAKPEQPAAKPDESAPTLHGFRIVNGRLFFLRGDRELVALDGDRGLVDWSFSPTAGTINSHLWVGPGHVVLQTRQPNSLLVLDTATGRRRGEFSQGLDQEEWARDPLPLDDDRVVLVADRRTVTLFDLARGVNSWVFRESRELPKNGPPRVLGDAERLLLLHDGNEIIRLDAATGTKRWSRPLGTEDLSERADAVALDTERVYWVSGQTLRAASLGDGAVVWSHQLSGPESGWSVELTERHVLAYPGVPRKPGDDLEGLSLVFRRREGGELVQRVRLPASVSTAVVRASGSGALVATQSGLWALEATASVDVPRPRR